MSNSLAFGQNNTKVTTTPTGAGLAWVMITARVDSTVTYTETYDDGSTAITVAEAISAGQTFYGIFSIISAPTGYVILGR
jgi:hypothetical protein